MYFLFHASVKNTLSSATDSLGNFEMCPCDHIEYWVFWDPTFIQSIYMKRKKAAFEVHLISKNNFGFTSGNHDQKF